MDVNEDGHPDLLSGSYSRMDRDMAGLFQVLLGEKGGGFAKPVVLKGTDEKPLIIPAQGKDADIDRICTRPTACDLDGDGDLDLLVGNFRGTFYLFEGLGKGRFAPEPKPVLATDGKALRVPAHSDPFVADWDGDGDLDVLSGSSRGGVALARNAGTEQAPRFEPIRWLLAPLPAEALGGLGGSVSFGTQHVTGPQGSTRVFAADVDEDGKLDLLVGDAFQIHAPAPGLDEAAARERLRAHQAKLEDADEDFDFQAWYAERARIISSRATGTVWLLRGK